MHRGLFEGESGMTLLEVKDIMFCYPGGKPAVAGVEIMADRGEKIAVIGQNGSGKTTLSKLLNGLLKPDSGYIYVDGEPTEKKTTAQISKKVGYVFQNPDDQIFNQTVYKEIAYTLKRQKKPRFEIEERVKKAAELTGITESLEENPYDLSFSLRKFVTIASVVAAEPEIIILDEPTAGQDAQGLVLLGRIVRQLAGQGKLVIVITHDMDFVCENFERVIVMANGKILMDGKTEDAFCHREVLEQASLKPPSITELAEELKIVPPVITLGQFIQHFTKP